MKEVYLLWLLNDDIDPLLIGVATTEDKALAMKKHSIAAWGYENEEDCDYEYEIVKFKLDTLIIDDKEIKF